MEGEIEIKIYFKNKKNAENFLESIKTELNNKERTKINANVKNNIVIIIIKSKDITALRASVNTFLRYAQLVEKIGD